MASLLCLALILTCAAGSREPLSLTPVARVDHPPLREISGAVASRTYPGVVWVHNDSGNGARLFAIRPDGSVLIPPWLTRRFSVGLGGEEEGLEPYPGIRVEQASNIDWESIALDGGFLYLADTGNNSNARRDLGVYVLAEPNPLAVHRLRVLKWLPIAYPDQDGFPPSQWHFDCEAVFCYQGRLYFLTKHRAPGEQDVPETGTTLYRLDTDYTDRLNVLTLVERHPDLGGWVTGADLSPDGRTLAVLCQSPEASIWLFQPREGDRFLSGKARRLPIEGVRQAEAITFLDEHRLLLLNEQRDIFLVPVDGRFQPPGR